MSEPQPTAGGTQDSQERIAPRPTLPYSEADGESNSSGPNLKLIYTILAVALAAAIGLALLIVLPFYHRP